jgi:hypothetical protein
MGIPYSKQMRTAFDQVTPLVAAGFDVLQTTKNVSLLLAATQVLTVLFLCSIQVTLLALLVTANPDLDEERRVLVTPVVRWLALWAMEPACFVDLAIFYGPCLALPVCLDRFCCIA